jgi:hypothetical protein
MTDCRPFVAEAGTDRRASSSTRNVIERAILLGSTFTTALCRHGADTEQGFSAGVEVFYGPAFGL